MKLTVRGTAYWDIYACVVSPKCWWLHWITLNTNEKEWVSVSAVWICGSSDSIWKTSWGHIKDLFDYNKLILFTDSSIIDLTVSVSISDWHCWGQVISCDRRRYLTEVCPQSDSTSLSDRMIEMLTCQYRVNAADVQVSVSKVTACQCFVLTVLWLSSQCCPEYKESSGFKKPGFNLISDLWLWIHV